jgi:hypothetical protein
MQYEIGERYPMTVNDGNAILRQMGMGAMMAQGKPDATRGRRYLGSEPDKWAFWMTSGQRVEVSISLTGNMYSDHFIASVTPKPDPQLPAPLE